MKKIKYEHEIKLLNQKITNSENDKSRYEQNIIRLKKANGRSNYR